MENLRKRIAKNFRRLRKSRGWTQAQVAERGEVDTSYIGQIETAQITFGVNAQIKWAKVFNVDVAEFTARSMEEVESTTSEAEALLLDLFRDLTAVAKEELMTVLDGLVDQDQEKKKERITKIREALRGTG